MRASLLPLLALAACDGVTLDVRCDETQFPGTTDDGTALGDALDAAFSGGALEVPATWADDAATTLTLSLDADVGAASRVESSCLGAQGWTVPAALTARTADGRLDADLGADVLVSGAGQVHLTVPEPGLDASTLADLGVPADATVTRSFYRVEDDGRGELAVNWTRATSGAEMDAATTLLSW